MEVNLCLMQIIHKWTWLWDTTWCCWSQYAY